MTARSPIVRRIPVAILRPLNISGRAIGAAGSPPYAARADDEARLRAGFPEVIRSRSPRSRHFGKVHLLWAIREQFSNQNFPCSNLPKRLAVPGDAKANP